MRITNLIKRLIALVALVMTSGAVYAENSSVVERAVREIVAKYDKESGVKCITVTKGQGLEIVKLMLREQMGKAFLKGVTSVTIIEYGSASAEVCEALRKEVDVFTSLLKEFNVSEAKATPNGGYSRGFANVIDADAGRVSDFVIAVDSDEMKSIIYMTGDMVVKEQ